MRSLAVWFCLLAAAAASPLTNQGLDRGYRQLYNLEFSAAHQTFADWIASHPADPLGPASNAVADLFAAMDRMQILQSQFFTNDHDFLAGPTGPPLPDFERELGVAESLAARAPANDTNALYAQALCHGLRADYLGVLQKRYLASVGEMKLGQAVAQRLLAIDPGKADAYLAVGIENYVLGLKPAPVRWLLRLDGASTNKVEGLRQLRLTAANGHYLQPYAKILLAIAALRDHDPATAAGLLEGLASEFPANPLYTTELRRLATTVTLDPARTEVHFTLPAFLHTVHGSFKLIHGSLEFDPATGKASGSIVLDTRSGETGNADRDKTMHATVLESEKYPTITFTVNQVTGALPNVNLQGVVNLHGADHALTIPVHAEQTGGQFTATATFDIPYVAWGLKNPSNALLHVKDTVALQITAAGTLTSPQR
jgi:polyisoprenoid-binding protein YceI